jgi:hypothetical protein
MLPVVTEDGALMLPACQDLRLGYQPQQVAQGTHTETAATATTAIQASRARVRGRIISLIP